MSRDIEDMVKVMSEERRDRAYALKAQTNEQLVVALERVMALIDSYWVAKDRGDKGADALLKKAKEMIEEMMGITK